MGDPSAPQDVQALLIDCALIQQLHWNGPMNGNKVKTVEKVTAFQQFCQTVLHSEEEKTALLANDYCGSCPALTAFLAADSVRMLHGNAWYQQLQEALVNDPQPPEALAPLDVDRLSTIGFSSADEDLVLQVQRRMFKPHTDLRIVSIVSP